MYANKTHLIVTYEIWKLRLPPLKAFLVIFIPPVL